MAGIDVITPMFGWLENLMNGPHFTFVIEQGGGRNGREITNLLHDEGIRTWFHNNSGEYFTFNTRKSDAAQAQQVLSANGIQTASPEPAGYKAQGKGKGKEPYQPGQGWSLFG